MALAFCGRLLAPKRLPLRNAIRSNGYIVLLPEIGEEGSQTPLLQNDGLPDFGDVTIEKCTALIGKHALEFEASVKLIEKKIDSAQDKLNIFSEVFDDLEEVGAPLDATWCVAKTLYLGNSSRMPSTSYKVLHAHAQKARVSKYNSPLIFQAVRHELSKKDAKHTREQERLLRKFALESKLNGLQLQPMQKIMFAKSWGELSRNKVLFRQKVDVATNQFSHIIEESAMVRDFPPELLQSIASDAQNPLKGPWKLTLEPKVYLGVLENCPDRDVRWNLWQASVGRGSGFGSRELSTSVHLEEIRGARGEIANLLGYKTFADMSMETKMAGNVQNVTDTLKTLLLRSKPAQDRELEELYEFALERGFKGSRIELWDLPYWRRKQQRSIFDFQEETYKAYFPLSKVLEGLFQLCHTLFGVRVKRRRDVSTWAKDVTFYDMYEEPSSAPIGGFYLDPYERGCDKLTSQPSTGWMVGIQSQRLITDTKPVAALIFNFEAPQKGRESHLSLKDLHSLFHKFGQALQHLLTRTAYSEVSGLSNIEWDAVELSGNFLTHWLQNKHVIESISRHAESKQPLPHEMFESMVNAQKHLAGVELSRELYLAALDLEVHSSKDFWLDIVKRLWPEFRSFPLDKLDSHPCSFTQIFTEDWGAAYFTRIWSRMLAADVYGAFHESQNDETKSAEVGKRLRNTFLLYGGSSHPSETFREFLGRDPSPKALLSSLGLK